MSQPAVRALDLPFELVYEDGEPLESLFHVSQMNLFFDLIDQVMEERGRNDYVVGGNAFVYYSLEQARDVAAGRPYFRGPDVFLVEGVERDSPGRKAWVSWEEGGRLPDLIVELLSPSTAHIDRKDKKDLYSRVFRTRDYFLYDFDTDTLEGFRLAGNAYQPIPPDANGRLRSDVLGLDLGLWQGEVRGVKRTWVRLYRPDGQLVPTPAETAEAERHRADTAEARAAAAEAELERLRSRLR
jgi:Uma2 family endonuclease